MSAEITETRGRSSVLPGLTASIAASELLLFSRDLRGPVTAVVVAATGRALAAHPEVDCALLPAGTGVGVAVDTDGGVLVPVVRNAADAQLPQVRDEVTRLIYEARTGKLSPGDVGGASVIVCEGVPMAGALGVDPPIGCILAVDRPESHSLDLTCALTVNSDVGREEAGRFFATFVRLLLHPYRLLV